MYTKNHDPNYFYDCPCEGNCGSFALNVKEWYISDRDFDNTDIAWDMEIQGYDLEAILDYLTSKNVEQILEDFTDEIRIVTEENEVKKDEELIAFRVGVFDDDFEEIDSDFHFRVKRGGQWMEKCGSTEVRECELEKDKFWSNSSGEIYNGPIVFFAKKI